MIASDSSVEKQVKAFCAKIGDDPLLVQGAGGNVSWKDGSVLWVKASGMWLADAESKEIFVPVNLRPLQDALAKQDFSVSPEIASNSGLRPSIETLLHALMPHRVVVHLHAVEILAYLVRINARQKIQDLVGDAVNWIFVDYVKPGADLARAIAEELKSRPTAEVIFMASHGVVVGGANIDDITATMHTLNSKLQSKTSTFEPKISKATRKSDFLTRGYMPCSDREVNQLAIKEELIGRLRNEWALYPDHVVFLGAEATILERNFTILEIDDVLYNKPPFIFAVGEGVYESLSASPGQKSQLRCYYDVVSRLGGEEMLSAFSKLKVSELLSWDAEKHRIELHI